MAMTSLRLSLATILTMIVLSCEGARILVVAPMFGKSHSIFIHPICTELLNRGHHVTTITTNLIKNPPENLVQIRLDEDTIAEIAKNFNPQTTRMFEHIPIMVRMFMMFPKIIDMTVRHLESPPVKKFIEEDKSNFDLVISEMFFQEAMYMFAHKYKAPLILLDTSTYMSSIASFMGDPSAISYTNHEIFDENYDDDSLQSRLKNHLMYFCMKGIEYFYAMPRNNRIAREFFEKSIDGPLPSLEDIQKRISAVLINSHFSIDSVRPTVPGVVEVGGLHMKEPQKLPQDIQEFLDDAKDGAILFSLGTVTFSSHIDEKILNAIISVFEQLNQKVLWKWESETPLPIHLKNVLTRKWLPQSDILAHPNLKLFITHCGMLSTQEVIHRGVPIIGLPIHGDQPMNMMRLINRGFGIGMSLSTVTEAKLLSAIKEVLSNPKYRENAKTASRIYHDRPLTPMNTAMYWIEYVIRNKGAPYMKSRAVHQAAYKYYSLDVILIFSIMALVYVAVTVKFILYLCGKCMRNKKNVVTSIKKKQ